MSDVLPDLVVPHWYDWVARALAPLVDTSPSTEASAIPSASRLLDVLDLPGEVEDPAPWLDRATVLGFFLQFAKDDPEGFRAALRESQKAAHSY